MGLGPRDLLKGRPWARTLLLCTRTGILEVFRHHLCSLGGEGMGPTSRRRGEMRESKVKPWRTAAPTWLKNT